MEEFVIPVLTALVSFLAGRLSKRTPVVEVAEVTEIELIPVASIAEFAPTKVRKPRRTTRRQLAPEHATRTSLDS